MTTPRQQMIQKSGKSTSKGPTAPTLPLSSGASPEGKAAQSVPFPKVENGAHSTTNTQNQSQTILRAALPTAPPTNESLMHADFARVALLALEKAGLCQREILLAEDGSPLAIRVVFSPSLWTEGLRLKV